MSVCAVLIAGLCFSALKADYAVEFSSIGSSVRATTDSYTATYYFDSDNITPTDWSRMSRSCVDGACILYHKRCRVTDQGRECLYSFGRAGDLEAALVVINSATDASLQEAESLIGVLTRGPTNAIIIPFTTFTRGSMQAAPTCRRDQAPTECWQHEYPGPM